MDLEKPVILPPFSEYESVTHQSKKDELYAAFIGDKRSEERRVGKECRL